MLAAVKYQSESQEDFNKWRLGVDYLKEKNYLKHKRKQINMRVSNTNKVFIGLVSLPFGIAFFNKMRQQSLIQQTVQLKQSLPLTSTFYHDDDLKDQAVLKVETYRLKMIKLYQNQQHLIKQRFIDSRVKARSILFQNIFKLSFDLLPHLILLGILLKGLRNLTNPKKYLGVILAFGGWSYTYPNIYKFYGSAVDIIIKNRIMPKINFHIREKEIQKFTWNQSNMFNMQNLPKYDQLL